MNKKGLDLIKKYEGFRKNAYQLKGEDFYTIGYGVARTYFSTGEQIKENDTITEEEAEKELMMYCEKYIVPTIEKCNKLLKENNLQELNENQESALMCLFYNTGTGKWFSTKCWKYILQNNNEEAIKEWDFGFYNVDKTMLNGIKKRRNEEIELFFGVKDYWK